MIATDLREPTLALAALGLFDFDPHVRISLLTTYRIPFLGLRMLPDTPRLVRAMDARARELTVAFVRSTALSSVWLDIHTGHGDARDQTWRHVQWSSFDFVVLAFGASSNLSRWATKRLAVKIVDRRGCDVAVLRRLGSEVPWPADEQLVAI